MHTYGNCVWGLINFSFILNFNFKVFFYVYFPVFKAEKRLQKLKIVRACFWGYWQIFVLHLLHSLHKSPYITNIHFKGILKLGIVAKNLNPLVLLNCWYNSVLPRLRLLQSQVVIDILILKGGKKNNKTFIVHLSLQVTRDAMKRKLLAPNHVVADTCFAILTLGWPPLIWLCSSISWSSLKIQSRTAIASVSSTWLEICTLSYL